MLRYLVAGGASYLVEIGSILLLIHLFHFSGLTSVAISFWIGLLTSFSLQKVFVFSSQATKRRTLKQFLLYLALVAVNYGFTLGFVALVSPAVDVALARTIALVITTAWNFLLYSKIIFRHEESPNISR